MLIRRSTHMVLADDFEQARRRYEAEGFRQSSIDETGCVSYVSEDESIILLDRNHAERRLPERAIALMQDKPALYIFVESLAEMREALRGNYLGEAHVGSSREWVLEIPQGVVVMAESVHHRGSNAVN